MSGLLAVEAESFPKELSSFFVCHGINGGFDRVNIHCVWVSVGSGLHVAPRTFIPFLDLLLEVPVPVKVVVIAVVFSLGGSGVSVNLVILNGFGEPSILVDSASGCLQVFKRVDFVGISHDLHGERGVQNSLENSYSEGVVLYLSTGF